MTYKRRPISWQTVCETQPAEYIDWDMKGKPIIDILERIDEALTHLHRSMVLLFNWDGQSERIDMDAHWNLAIIQTGAAIEGWKDLNKAERSYRSSPPPPDATSTYWSLRNLYAHILGTTTKWKAAPELSDPGMPQAYSRRIRTRYGKEDVHWTNPLNRELRGFVPLSAGYDVYIKPLRDFLASLLEQVAQHPEYDLDQSEADAHALAELRTSVEVRLHDKDWLHKEYEEQNRREVTADWMKRSIMKPYDVEYSPFIGIGNLTSDPDHYKDEIDVINRAIETAIRSADPVHASLAQVSWTEGVHGRMYRKRPARWLDMAKWILTNPDNEFGSFLSVNKAVSMIHEAVEAWQDEHSPNRYKYIKEWDLLIPASAGRGEVADSVLEKDYDPEDVARWMFSAKGELAERLAKEWQPDG